MKTEELKVNLDLPQILIQFCEQLGKQTEVHIHFIINSTVVGNNIDGSNNYINPNP